MEKEIKKETYQARVADFFDTYENYRYGFILGYSHSPLELESLRKTGSLMDLYPCDFETVNRVVKDNDKSNEYVEECDNWLTSIGFYDDGGETYYQYGIVLKDIKKYDKPKEINMFKNKDGARIEKAPQSFMYTKD